MLVKCVNIGSWVTLHSIPKPAQRGFAHVSSAPNRFRHRKHENVTIAVFSMASLSCVLFHVELVDPRSSSSRKKNILVGSKHATMRPTWQSCSQQISHLAPKFLPNTFIYDYVSNDRAIKSVIPALLQRPVSAYNTEMHGAIKSENTFGGLQYPAPCYCLRCTASICCLTCSVRCMLPRPLLFADASAADANAANAPFSVCCIFFEP